MREIRQQTAETLVEKITDDVVSTLKEKTNPRAIILKGSFGRDEPSLITTQEIEVKFISDYEVELISLTFAINRILSKNNLSFLADLSSKYGLKIDIGGLKLSIYYYLPLMYRTLRPTIANYDLKYGSKVVYGEDILKRIPQFKADEIPLHEGLKLLFNRIAEAHQYFDIDYTSKILSEDDRQNLFFWTNKIILACQDLLLIYSHSYHHSYKHRNEIFRSIFPTEFSDLHKKNPHFLLLTINATNYKLDPRQQYSTDVIDLWFKVRDIVEQTLELVLKKDSRITTQYCPYNADGVLELFDEHLKQQKIFPTIKQNLIVIVKYWISNYRLLPLTTIVNLSKNWPLIVYFHILCLYFCPQRDGTIDYKMFAERMQLLSIIIENKDLETISDERSKWISLKRQGLHYWRTMCY